MPAPQTGTAILALVLFVMPGFVTILVKERIYEVPAEQQAFERLLQAVYYSLLVYAIPLGVAVLVGAEVRDARSLLNGKVDARVSVAYAVTVLLVLPAVVAYSGRRWLISETRLSLLRWLKISTTHRTSSSWDFAFEDEEPCLVVVWLKSGTRVAGFYGPRSHSGYGTQRPDLFLEELWNIEADDDGDVSLTPNRTSIGVWLNADEIATFERYAVSDEQAAELRQQ